jgi:hypothetical protein
MKHNPTMPILRDNQTWLADLRSTGEPRDAALQDLHTILQRILPKALALSGDRSLRCLAGRCHSGNPDASDGSSGLF